MKGIEINVRKSLGFLAPGSFLQDLYLSGNATFLKGDVTYNLDKLVSDAAGTENNSNMQDRSRPLQGLAPILSMQVWLMTGRCSARPLIMAVAVDGWCLPATMPSTTNMKLRAMYSIYRFPPVSSRETGSEGSMPATCSMRTLSFTATAVVSAGVDPGNDKSYADLTSDMNYNPGDWVMSRIKKGISLSLSVGYKF